MTPRPVALALTLAAGAALECTPTAPAPGPTVATAAPTPPDPPETSAPDAAAPAREPSAPAIDAATARAAALRVLLRFVDKSFAEPALEPGGETPSCDAGPCEYVFTGSAVVQGERDPVAVLYVDAASGKVFYKPNDGKDQRWEPDAYAAFLEGSDKAIAAVTALPEVRRLCAALEKRGVHCQLWIDEASSAECPKSPDLHDACLWSVYLGESHPTHSVRLATVVVESGVWSVLGGSTLACDVMPLAAFSKQLRALMSTGPAPACP